MIPLPTLEVYASQYVGAPVTIACQPDATFPTGAAIGAAVSGVLDGFVLAGANGAFLNVIHLRQSECNALEHLDRKRTRNPASYVALQSTGQRIDEADGRAVGVLMHEATHIVTGSLDEPEVECLSWRNAWQLIRQFKLPAWVARIELASVTWHHQSMDASYQKAGC